MSTQPQYDPEKANAWTRDLPAKPPIKERPSFIVGDDNPFAMAPEHRKRFNDLANFIGALEARSRAVIAAGRPHEGGDVGRFPYARVCPCPQCAAWDALKQLLETP